MKAISLCFLLLALTCKPPKKDNSESQKNVLETTTTDTVKDELVIALKNPKEIANIKAFITNSGLQWKKMLFDDVNTKIALIKVPAEKRDFWLERLQQSGLFKSVELNGIMTIKKLANRAEKSFLDFRKTPCFGDCPVYEVSINKDGKIYYNGINYVLIKGKKEFQLTEKQFSTLKEKLAKKSFSDFKDSYDDPQIKDLPSTYLTCNGKQIHIRIWKDIPDELVGIIEYLEDILVEKKCFNLE